MINKTLQYCLGSILILLILACKTTQQRTGHWKEIPSFGELVQTNIESSPVFSKSFTGFTLFDPTRNQLIAQYNADKYFTPASNTKIFTFYASLKILKDSIAGLQFQVRNDSLIFWGTGDPTLLHPYLQDSSRVIDFLRSRSEHLFFSSQNFEDTHFGSGWAWDDYYYAYQAEKSPLPMYGNTIQAKGCGDGQLLIHPGFFKKTFEIRPSNWSVRRLQDSNIFHYTPSLATDTSFQRNIPFKYSPELVAELLEQATGKRIRVTDIPFPDSIEMEVIYSQPVDTVYRRMMQISDNFLAEQLMLLCSSKIFGSLNTRKAIQYAKDSLLQDLPDEAFWVDGSGLSRYNLFTPRSIVKLLHKIYQSLPEERIFSIFPAGGSSGTIEQWYGSEEGPYVFAKTGTLRNKHCLSGYLKTKNGNTLIFSFMHNNYITSSSVLKKEMEKILRFIREHY